MIHRLTAFVKKCTPHNLLVKWPLIVLRRFKEKIRRTPLRMLLFRNAPVVLQDHYGIRFILYPWDDVPLEKLLTRRNYRDEFRALKKLIKPEMCVMDIGTNIGLHATLFSRWVGPTGTVHAFEPIPDTFWLLKETLALNRCTNVTSQLLALSDTIGSVPMHLFDLPHSVWNSFGTPQFGDKKPSTTVSVATTTIDEFCRLNAIEQVDFAKIDVEGAEIKVLNGAANLLARKRITTFSFEISQIPLAGIGLTAEQVFSSVLSYGYTIYRFDPTTDRFVGPVTSTDSFYENYYASVNNLTQL